MYLHSLLLLTTVLAAVSCKKMQPISEEKFKFIGDMKCFIHDEKGNLLPDARNLYEKVFKPDNYTVEEFEHFTCDFFDFAPFVSKHVHKDNSWYTPSPGDGKDGWLIVYGFTSNCLKEKEEKKELEESISRYLRLWLSPLADMKVVDNFYYQEVEVTNDYKFKLDSLGKKDPHLKFVFNCKRYGGSYMNLEKFYIFMDYSNRDKKHKSLLLCGKDYVKNSSCENAGYQEGGYSMETLLHEIGHAFGLADTYERGSSLDDRGVTEGQPMSVMAGGGFYSTDTTLELKDSLVLAEDDKNGIRYIYNYVYKNTTNNECPSEDYEYVEKSGKETPLSLTSIGTCIPKLPFIYKLKQAYLQEQRHKDTQLASIIIAASKYNISLQKSIFDHGRAESLFKAEKINAQDNDGNSGLHYAVKFGAKSTELKSNWLELLDKLLKIDTCNPTQDKIICLDLNILNNEGKTALHIAVEEEYLDAVSKLLTKGIDKNIRNKAGKTALDYSKKQEITNILQR